MAKGKHAAALFEVINSGKDRNKTGALSTPKWWFKNRPKAEEPASVPVADTPAPAPTEEAANDPTLRASESIFKPAAPSPSPAASSAARAQAFRRLSSTESSESSMSRFSQQLTYRNAALAAGAILLIGGGAFVVGKKLGGGPQPVNATPIETLRMGKPNGNALNVNAGSASSGATAPLSQDAGTFAGNSPTSNGGAPTNSSQNSAQGAPRTSPSQPPATFDPNAQVRRVVGMQYVMIQSYPKESDAIAAADICTRNGVPCTIQKGFWPQKPDWLAVIGTTGFERTRNNPEYEAYLKQITQISEKFAAKSKFRQFEPFLFTWKEAGVPKG